MSAKVIFRKHSWFSMADRSVKYGIQAKVIGQGREWMNCKQGTSPMIYDTEKERDAKMKELRAQQKASSK